MMIFAEATAMLAVVQDESMRTLLLILLVLAVILLIVGAVIALLTFSSMHKAAATQPERTHQDREQL